MEAVQRHVAKLFRRDRTPPSPTHGAPLSESKSESNLGATWLKRRWRSSLGSPKSDHDGEESDSAKYWTSAKTRRKLKHLGARRELPPLPPGAATRTPDIFGHSPIRFGRGMESPAHIYEEIPSWALDGEVGHSQHWQMTESSHHVDLVRKTPEMPLPNNTRESGERKGFCIVGSRMNTHQPAFHRNSDFAHRANPAHQMPNKPIHHSYSEVTIPTKCSSSAHTGHHLDLLNVPPITARSDQPAREQTFTMPNHTSHHQHPGFQPQTPQASGFHIGHSHRDHQTPSNLPPGNTQQNRGGINHHVETLVEDLDKLDIPVQDQDDFLSSSRDNLCEADNPLAVYEAKGSSKISHGHDDSVDACYEYDYNSSVGRRSNDNTSSSQSRTSSDSTSQKDPFRSCDKGSFRSHDGSHGKSESSSNDTFSEYDIKSDSSACDYEGDYEYILSKIRDNLKLKEDVQKLACKGSQQSVDSSATLTSVSSLSEISTLADEEIRRLLASSKSSLTSQYSLTSSSPTAAGPSGFKKLLTQSKRASALKDSPKESSLSSAKDCQKVKTHGRFSSSIDLSSQNQTPKSEPTRRRSGSVSCLSSGDEGKLSCRVSTLKPDAMVRKPPHATKRQNAGLVNNRPYAGNNRLLADIMQRNHDRQTLFL